MLDFHLGTAAVQTSTQLQQASDVARNQPVSAAFEELIQFSVEHSRRDVGMFDREETAKAAALLDAAVVNHLNPGEACHCRSWFFVDAQATQQMARRVIGNGRLELASQRLFAFVSRHERTELRAT